MIASFVAPNSFAGNTLITSLDPIEPKFLAYLVSVLNSFVFDFLIRQRVTAHCNMFYVYQMPVPRFTNKDEFVKSIVTRAAKLTCTTPEFDDLARDLGLKSHANGVTDATGRGHLRAELDGLIAHLYGLTEVEFSHVLRAFPIVPDPVKIAALNAYRDVAKGLIK